MSAPRLLPPGAGGIALTVAALCLGAGLPGYGQILTGPAAIGQGSPPAKPPAANKPATPDPARRPALRPTAPRSSKPAPKPAGPPGAPAPSGDVDLAFGAFQRGYYLTAFHEATKRVNDKGDPRAMTLLGELYANGLGVS